MFIGYSRRFQFGAAEKFESLKKSAGVMKLWTAPATLLLFGALAGCGSAGPTNIVMPLSQQVDVSGNHMTLDGNPWLSRGVTLQGFVRPLAQLQSEAPTDKQAAAILNARQIFNADELAAIKAYQADTIRLQVSQPALDPASSLYDPQYFKDVKQAIREARANGFVVMVMMQDETITGDAKQDPLPSTETQNDWDLFASAFGTDRGVVFELYNEPSLLANSANWLLWLNGGQFQGQSYLGMQTLVSHLRGEGAQNVFVVDGLGVEIVNQSDPTDIVREASATLLNVQVVADPLHRIVYAVHPYQHGLPYEDRWDEEFGTPSMTLPVWADEWSAPTQLALGLGELPDYQIAVDFLNYARLHSIPICTGAFDVPDFVIQQAPLASQPDPTWPLNNYDNFSATTMIDGSGTLVHNDFVNNYSRPLTAADGL